MITTIAEAFEKYFPESGPHNVVTEEMMIALLHAMRKRGAIEQEIIDVIDDYFGALPTPDIRE